MKGYFKVVWCFAVIGLFIAGVTLGDAEAEDYGKWSNIRMASATPGGTWYPVAVGVAEIAQKKLPGLVINVGSGGSQANCKALERDMTELAMVFSADMILSIRGNPPFDKPSEKLRDMMMLFGSPFQIMVRRDSGIKTIADLKGKRVGTVQKGTGGEYMTRMVLKVHGVSYEDLAKIEFAPSSDLIALMKDKHLDAVGYQSGVPVPFVLEVGAFEKVRLLDIGPEAQKKLREINPGYTQYVIPKDTYAAQGHPEAIQTMTMTTRLVTTKNMPEKLGYGIVKAVAENMSDLSMIVHEMKTLKPKDLYQDTGVPLHPGAARYFKEIGVDIK